MPNAEPLTAQPSPVAPPASPVTPAAFLAALTPLLHEISPQESPRQGAVSGPRALEAEAIKLEPIKLLVCVSGGPDSMALLGLMAKTAPCPIAVASVDHGLRAAAKAECAKVDAFCAERGIAHATLGWLTSWPKPASQEEARRGRYALLAQHAYAHGCTALVVGHHADDQAETVLMRLCAGSGPAGLAGMHRLGQAPQPEFLANSAPNAPALPLLRPLLGFTKAQLVATCRVQGWPFTHDTSNIDPRFARARWRKAHNMLAAEGLTSVRLCRLAHRMQRLEEALAFHLNRLPALTFLPAPQDLPEELVLRALMREVARFGAAPSLARSEALLVRLRAAQAAHMPFKSTLGGALVTYRPPHLQVTQAPPRLRAQLIK